VNCDFKREYDIGRKNTGAGRVRVWVGLRVENFCTGRVRVRKVVPVQYSSNKLLLKANYVKCDDLVMKPVPTSIWQEFVDRPVAVRPVRSVRSLVKRTKKLFNKSYQTKKIIRHYTYEY